MLGAVGRDEYGARLRASLSSCGVDCSAVANADAHTGLAFITVCRGDNCIVIDSGANGAVLPETIRQHAALLDWADILVLQLEIPLETVAYAAKAAKAAGTFVILIGLKPCACRPDAARDIAAPCRSADSKRT